MSNIGLFYIFSVESFSSPIGKSRNKVLKAFAKMLQFFNKNLAENNSIQLKQNKAFSIRKEKPRKKSWTDICIIFGVLVTNYEVHQPIFFWIFYTSKHADDLSATISIHGYYYS